MTVKNFEQIRKNQQAPDESFDRSFRFESKLLERLLESLPFEKIKTIADTSLGNGWVAQILLDRFLSKESFYRAFEPSARLAQLASQRLKPWADRATISALDPVGSLSLPDSSQDALLTLHLFEFMRMDQIYMSCAEARRVVKPGGIWVLAGLAPNSHSIGKPLSFIWNWLLPMRSRWKGGRRPLDLFHYISPEDWKILKNERIKSDGQYFQFLLLERIL